MPPTTTNPSEDMNNSFIRYKLSVQIVISISILSLLYLANMNLTVAYQAYFGWGMVLILLISRNFKVTDTPLGKMFLLTLITFISFRYLFWRTTDTLVYTYLLEFIFVALIFIAEIEVAIVHLLGVFSNVWPMNRGKSPPIPLNINSVPTVDIFIPTYNEAESMVEITALACLQINYPKQKLRIHILDDGASIQKRNSPVEGSIAWHRYNRLKAFCDQHSINYITRPENLNAKAGNINYAMSQTDSELILCLDCDHVPTKDFLQNTIGYFIKDPKLFLVQTPHFFINPDPVEKSLGTHHQAPSENEMFFRGTHLGIDLWNSSFFCGSAAVLRRSCLEEVGGFSGETITEDAEISIALHAKGYNSVYVKKPMVCGLSPETFADFITQRSRWCQGMLQIGFLKNPVMMKGLSLAQKICYTGFYLFWFFGFARVMFFIAPSLFILFDLHIYHASSVQVIAYALPHLFVSFIAADILYGKYRWPLFSELYESIQSLFLLKAVLGVISNPHKPTFKVTPKGKHLDHDLLSPLSGPFYLLFFIMLISLPIAGYRWVHEPVLRDVILICVCWLTLNLVLSLASLGAFWDKHQIRSHHRAWATGSVVLKTMITDTLISAKVTDLSLTGMGVVMSREENVSLEDRLYVESTDSYGEQYKIAAKIIRISDNDKEKKCGLVFLDYEKNLTTLITFVYGDSRRWSEFWERGGKSPNIGYSFYYLLKMGIKGSRHSLMGMKIMSVYWAKTLGDQLKGLQTKQGRDYEKL